MKANIKKKIKTIRVTGRIEHRLPDIAMSFLTPQKSKDDIVGNISFPGSKKKYTNAMRPKRRTLQKRNIN